MGSAKLRLVRGAGLTLGLQTASAILFALAFPSPVSSNGIGVLGFVALIPFFTAVNRMRWWASPIWGLLFGFGSYALFNYWLANFHPLAIFIVPVIYAGYFMLLVPLLVLARAVFPRWGFLVQLCFWLAYEYLRTQWYLGYSYGIMGYSQYQFAELVRLSSITGVWGVSLLVVFPSVFIAWLVSARLRRGQWLPPSGGERLRQVILPAAVYAMALLTALGYGFSQHIDLHDSPRVRMALIQQNIDPWVGGNRAFRKSLDILTRETDAALDADPDIDMVVWSETSFVPSIDFHHRVRANIETYELVDRLTGYLRTHDVPFVIGNGDRQYRRSAAGRLETYDYNAVLLMQDGEIRETYRKTHLVPFTEHFPYQRQLPWLHRLLVENDTTFWEEGDEYTVFEAAGIRFSTPICFEDTFGYLNRRFVNEGAEVLVNLTNDSWAKSVPSAMQHLGMAVFRAAENQRSLVRSTNGGMTALINPNAEIVAMLPAFIEGHLIVDVPVYTESDTLYTRYGDWLAFASLGAAFLLLLWAGALRIIRLTETDEQRHNE